MYRLTYLTIVLTLVTQVFATAQSTVTNAAQTTANYYRQTSGVVAEVMKNEAAKSVVLAGVYSGYYPDEGILLNDLLNPTVSPVYSDRGKVGELNITAFSTAFRSVLSSGRYPHASEFTNVRDLENFLIANKARIYFPYSENFAGQRINPVVVANPMDNREANNGLLLNDAKTDFQVVRVDDNYAYDNPVLIITKLDGNPNPTPDGGSSNTQVTGRGGGDGDCTIPPLRMSVYVEDVRCDYQWDALWNGGPEFYFCRGSIVYVAGGSQVQGAANAILSSLSRKDVRKFRWVRINALWDSNWQFTQGALEEIEQQCGVYEEDEGGSTTFGLNGSAKVEIKIPEVGGVEQSVGANISHTMTADDDIIYNQQWDRCWFITTNPGNEGLGIQNSKCVRGVNGNRKLHFTMRITAF